MVGPNHEDPSRYITTHVNWWQMCYYKQKENTNNMEENDTYQMYRRTTQDQMYENMQKDNNEEENIKDTMGKGKVKIYNN